MYTPSYFKMEDTDTLYSFMETYSFGMLLSNSPDGPLCTHLPFLVDRENNRLITHMAKANPHWQYAHERVLVVFHGPHAYISPTWYEEENVVPTWNYAAVHVYGMMRVVEDPERTMDILRNTVDYYESQMPAPWKADFSNEYQEKLLGGLVAVEIPIDSIEGKMKMSQNHSLLRRMRVIDALREQGDPGSMGVAKLMEKQLGRE